MAPKETVKKIAKKRMKTDERKVPPKRKRKNNSKPKPKKPAMLKPKKAVQWVNPALKLIQNVAGHPPVDAINNHAHSSMLQLPLQSGILTQDNLHRHFEPPSWTTTYPVPLITHQHTPEPGHHMFVDPIMKLMKVKKSHLIISNNARINYLRRKTMFKKACKGREGRVYPRMVYKFAEHLERDPDRWFSDEMGYDYYFTSGNLAIVGGEKFRWIVNTVGENMNVIEMVQFGVIENQVEVDSSTMGRHELSKEDGAVFEVCWSEEEGAYENDSTTEMNDLNVSTGTCLTIALRRKHKLDILWIDGGHDSTKTQVISSEVPFITCCFLQGRSDSLIFTADLDKKLKIWDYDENKVLHELQLKKTNNSDDGWTCLRTIKKNYAICLDRSSIKLFKTKDNLTLVQETPISMWLWTCERASCLEVCTENKFLFIGTSHKLLIIRLVDSQDAEPPEFQQIITFSHNLKHFPTMTKFGSDSNQNYYVWISSQLPGDTTICNFSKLPPKRFATNNLPQKPLTVQESYHLARVKGKCIHTTSTLKRRLQLCHSGITMLVHSDRIHLLLQTSFGDIFQQQIIVGPDGSNAEEIPALYHTWMLKLNTLNENLSTPLATDFKHFRGFKKILTCTNIDPPTVPKPLFNPFLKRPRWRQSVEQLHQYKDLLAADMLSIWGYRPDVTHEQQQQQQRRRLSTDESMNATDYITNWLDATGNDVTVVNEQEASGQEDLFESKVEILENAVPMITQEIPQADVTYVGTMGSGGVMNGTPRSAIKPCKRKYVQGF